MSSLNGSSSRLAKTLLVLGLPLATLSCGGGGGGGETDAGAGGNDGAGASDTGATGQGGEGGSPPVDIEGCELTTQALSIGEASVPSVLWTGSDYAIAFVEGGAVRLAVVDSFGTIQHEALVSNGGEAALPSLRLLQEGVIIAVWSEGGDVLARRIDTSAGMLSAPVVVDQTTSSEPRPSAAPLAGGQFALAWMEQPLITLSTVEDGAVVSSTQIDGWFPALAARDGQVGVAWSAGSEVGPVHFALADQVDTPSVVPESSSLIKSVEATNDGFLVAWEQETGEEPSVMLASFDAAGAFVAKKQLSPGADSANWPSLAWTGSQMAMVYYQFRGGGTPNTYLSLVDPATLSLAEEEILIAENAKYPTVAAGSSSLAIAYAVVGGPVELALLACEE